MICQNVTLLVLPSAPHPPKHGQNTICSEGKSQRKENNGGDPKVILISREPSSVIQDQPFLSGRSAGLPLPPVS